VTINKIACVWNETRADRAGFARDEYPTTAAVCTAGKRE